MPDRQESPRLVVKPARPDLTVMHPVKMRPIHPDGEDVTHHRGYFNRMLRTGDVVLVEQTARKRKGA